MDFSSLNPATSNSLNIAARNNNVKTVKRLLKKINVNCTDNRGWTCLHEAAANDSFQCLKLILENEDVRPLVETHEGHTALYLACRFKSSIKTIKYLLDTTPDIANYGSNEGVTPLHIACSQGNIELIKLLVDYGAIIDVQDFDGDTPLHDAVLSSQYEVIATLLHAGADPEIRNTQELTAFHVACFNGCIQILNIIFPFVIDINQLAGNGNSPLILAAQGSNDENVKFLLENGGDPHIKNKDGAIALTLALYVGHLPTFKLLLNVTDINKMDHHIILTACMENYFKIGILESLLMLDLGPEFFNYNTPFNFNPEYVGLSAQVYLTNAPINMYLKICEYIYLKSRDKFQQFFYLFLMRGLSVDAIDVNECPPLVYIHYCMHSACFSDVSKDVLDMLKCLVIYDKNNFLQKVNVAYGTQNNIKL